MNNITFEVSSLSEQLGIYDFFNVLISGAIFVFGLGIINSEVGKFIYEEITVSKGVCIVLIIYIVGLVIQEIASILDKKCLDLYIGMNRRILKGTVIEKCINCKNCEQLKDNRIVENPLLLKQYRKHADVILGDLISDNSDQRFENKYVNGFVFSTCQYYVAIKGQDKKVEKMRALFSMSKSLMVCFGLFATYMLCTIIFNTEISIQICDELGLSSCYYNHCLDKIILFMIFSIMTMIFLCRAKRVMKRFLLILLGTYDAIKRSEEVEHKRTIMM